MLMKRIFALGAIIILAFACDRPKPVLEVSNHLWPDGTAVSVLSGGKIVAGSILYGDHVRIPCPRRGVCMVRAAAPAVISAVSPQLTLIGGITSYTLPVPVMRRRIGTVNLGIGCAAPGADSLCRSLIDRSSASITSLSLEPEAVSDLAAIISHAHARAVEVILRVNCGGRSGKGALKNALAWVEKAERLGADGILFIPGENMWGDGTFHGAVRALASSLHGKGMSLAVALASEVLDDVHPAAFFDRVPSQECPDELLLLCCGAGLKEKSPEVVSISQIERALLKIMEEQIPLSRISLEVRLSALAYRGSGTVREPVPLAAGAFETISGEAGRGSAIRMGDGSLLLGYRGVSYLYEDLAGIGEKIRFLRTGEFARVRGLQILYDGLGLRPDEAGLRTLAGVFEGQ